MDNSERAFINLSLSQGTPLPSSVLTTSLPAILDRAATLETGIVLEMGNSQPDFLAYKDLLADANSVATALHQRGLQPQDRVIIRLHNPRYFFICLWGCWLAGFVPVPLGIEPMGDRSKLVRAAILCDPSLAIADEPVADLVTVRVEDLLASNGKADWHRGKIDDLALLLLTSGSTGQPKGVMLSVRNLIASIYGMATVNKLSQADISLNWMPIEHVASLVMFHLTQVYLGCQQIQVKSELILQNPLYWLYLIDRDRVTTTWSPNFAYNLVNERLKNHENKSNWDLSCLRWMGNGAEAVVSQTAGRFLSLLADYGLSPTVVSPGYGMSETTSGIAHSHDFYLNLDRDYVSVGAPIPGVSLRIVDRENRLLAEGDIGLLQVKGETVTAGYYNQPELNCDIFTDDGWFETGDLGFIKSGQLTITGRQKDVIVINGVNYFNHEIEAVVEEIAGVTVSYTAACSVIDANQQEQIAVFFNTEEKDSLRELVNTIRKSVFTQIGVAPTYIIPVASEAIPKTAIGKIKRSQLSQQFAQGDFDEVVAAITELADRRNLSSQELPGNAIEQELVAVWQEVLNLARVGVRDNFFELGGNSLLLMQVLSKLTPKYDLSAVTLFQYPTITTLASYLNSDGESTAIEQGKRRGLRRKATGNKDVAIIGMSCRFPGANNIDEFWSNLCNGVESISFLSDAEIIDSGVDVDLVSHPNYVKASPILENIENFDADFWGYSPKEAQLLDPQQRLFMECAWECLEDAGYDPFNYDGDIGLYGGAATNTYLLNNIYPNRDRLDERDDLQVVNLSSMGGFQVTTANDKDYLTTRTSYKLNLTGSSVNVQTACSTSLVTVHLACQSLINAECDIALTGGVSVHSPQKMGYLYQEGMILSADGHCRAFDAEASGTIFGSGAGIVALKLLDRAIADGDRIYGVIKGSAVNNDGGNKVGYFAPNVDGQTRVIAEAIAYANIKPETIGYVEAHGTGTKLGDPIEITALSQTYGSKESIRGENNCAVGSVKTNVGHLQMASGIIGLIKATLCLYHQKIVPSLHFNNPNSQIDFERSPFYLNTKLQDWKANSYPRRAGVNSLGIGGTNAHVIIEEYLNKDKDLDTPLTAYLLTLSAKNKAALAEQVTNYHNFLKTQDSVSLADICFTSNVGRHHFDNRLAIVASDKEELIDKLARVKIDPVTTQSKKLAFLFTGQGSQYIGMGQQLYDLQPVFRANCDRCFAILESYLDLPIAEMYGDKAARFDIGRTEYAQPLLFTIEYSLAQLWLDWGITPDVMVGHSLGEYVAAAIAGVFSLKDALKLVTTRAKLMQSLPQNGEMLAVFTTLDRVSGFLDRDVSLAADNGTHIVLSGLKNKVDRLAEKLASLEIETKRLQVSHAFHSVLMQPIIAEFQAVAKTVTYSTPKIPIVSNLTAELSSKKIASYEYWSKHILKPVQFAKSIDFLADRQVNIFLEIGAKPTLITMARGILERGLFLYSLNPKSEDWRNILKTISDLYATGIDLNWQNIDQYFAQKTSLPTYPFQRQRYWFDSPQRSDRFKPVDRKAVHPLLGKTLSTPLKQTIFQSDLNSSFSWLQDHRIDRQIIFPGAAYLEMALALGMNHYKTNSLAIEKVSIISPLLLNDRLNHAPQIQTISTPEADAITWEIYSANNDWQIHCSGCISNLSSPITGEFLTEIKNKFIGAELESDRHYQSCQQKGINYGKSFQGIKQLWAKDNQALGLIELPKHLVSQEYHFHPALLDACLQVLFAVLPIELQSNVYVPVGLDSLSVQFKAENRVWSYLELKENGNGKTIVADVWLYDEEKGLIARLKGLKSHLKSPSTKAQPAWHNLLYQPQWRSQSLSTTVTLPKQGNWLIFADDNEIGKQLATKLKSQQQQCHLVKRDRHFDRPQAWRDLIQQHSRVTGIIYLWSLDTNKNYSERHYLYLLQALIQDANNPSLWFVTRNAQPVGQISATATNSSLWGMQKAIALEHPELHCVGIDLDLDNAVDNIDNILRELSQKNSEQIAYRQNQRYVSRLVRYSWQTPKNKSREHLQLQIENPGNLDTLVWKSVPRKQPQANEIEIAVKATGLNFRDVMVALDLYPDATKFLGLECAGVVTQLGTGVTDFQVGDEVMAIAENSFSQYLAVDSRLAINKPQHLSFTEAATIPVTFLTAYYTLIHVAKLQPGEKILIHAAAGGVGLAAIQIAQQIGAEIYATASKPKWSLLESMGVKHIMNSRSLDFAAEIHSVTNGMGVDVVLNSLAGDFIAKSLSILPEKGRFIEIGKQGIWSKEDVAVVKPNIDYAVIDLWQITQDRPALIQHMLGELHSKLHEPQLNNKTLKPLPQKVFTQDKTIDAFRYMQQGKHHGKIIISGNPIAISSQEQLAIDVTYKGTYLITGGMGAIGLQIAQWLISKGVKHLVLLGRSEIKPQYRNRLEKLQENAQVEPIKADVANSDRLEDVLQQIESKLPPLKGVIHCAGTTSDRTILQQDWQSFKSVLAPKVEGAKNLHQLTQKYDLETFILFSSAASLIGSAGQANYCAANAYLDALAYARRSIGLPAMSINWSAWENTGLAKNIQITAGLKQKGIDNIKPQLGIEIIEQLVSQPSAQIGVMPIDWDIWQQHNSVTPYFEDLVSVKDFPTITSSYKQELLAASLKAREALLNKQMSQQVGNILGIQDISKIDREQGFSELGLDSLGSVELRNKLQSIYDLKLSQTAIFDYPNIQQLQQHLFLLIFKQTESENKQPDLDKSIEDLSESEAELELLAELDKMDY